MSTPATPSTPERARRTRGTSERRVASLFGLKGDSWMRHANPWSVWTRFAVLPLLILPFPRLKLTLDIDPCALLHVLLGHLGEPFAEDHDPVPLGPLAALPVTTLRGAGDATHAAQILRLTASGPRALAEERAPGIGLDRVLFVEGRLLGFLVGTIGRRVLEKAFENSVKAIEARNSTARAARAAGAS